MLFNSFEFIFLFLPLTWLLYQVLRRFKWHRTAIASLVIASLVFYGSWMPRYLVLVAFSLSFNYVVGRQLHTLGTSGSRYGRPTLWLGVAVNLGLLVYFKYANFIVDNIDRTFGTSITMSRIILPIGISFFTFQQIAFLVDSHRRRVGAFGFPDYCLFVTFFPQWIAGPIVHHAEMMPQFASSRAPNPLGNLPVGITIFVMGLAKKVILADWVAAGVTPVFNTAEAGSGLVDPLSAWIGVGCYTMQIYFDFSGYSDMAIGLGRMFGILLPINFASPYKSTSIVEFWRRWHITLSRFLRDYLYISLGGNRVSSRRRSFNVFATMVLGGIWHGAGWNFLLWGVLHGSYLAVNQRYSKRTKGSGVFSRGWIAGPLTLLCVVLAWVPFRATDLSATVVMYRSLLGMGSHSVGVSIEPSVAYLALPICLFVALLLPNTQQIMHKFEPALTPEGYPADEPPDWSVLSWRPNLLTAGVVATLFSFCVLKLNDISEFIYFQF